MGPFIFVSSVVKSGTKKSVHQFFPDIRRHGKEKFNLPVQFKDKQFGSIIAIRRGPYTKQKFNDSYVEVEPWYASEVLFGGSVFECLEFVVKIVVGSLLLDQFIGVLKTASTIEQTEYIRDQFLGVIGVDSIKMRLNHVISELRDYYEEMESATYSNES